MEKKADAELIHAYLAGDQSALETLVSRYLADVYRFVYRYTANVQDAEDIVQETFLKAWRHIKRFDTEKSFKTWIFAIAKNTAFDFFKKKRPAVFSEFMTGDTENSFIENIPDEAPLSFEIFASNNDKEKLERALEKMSLPERTVLFLRYNDHFSFREIAEILQESLNTVKSRYRRAVEKLKGLLEENT